MTKVNSFALNNDQERALKAIESFINDDKCHIFILTGYAGTGKTTLIKEIVNNMAHHKEYNFSLLASTGRAAKVMANITTHPTSTIHGQIYTYHDFNQELDSITQEISGTGVDSSGQLFLTFELITVTTTVAHVYIIDEASMISDVLDKHIYQAQFGSGRLLQDLLRYNPHGKFIFVGDPCQLPPISETFSPALNASYLKKVYQLNVGETSLTHIMRQDGDNDIIVAATQIRQLCEAAPTELPFGGTLQKVWSKVPLQGYRNIILHEGNIENLIDDYMVHLRTGGFSSTTLICRSNYKSTQLSNIIRNRLGRKSLIEKGDLMLVTQNNLISGLMNGDLVTVEQVNDNCEKRAGLTFRNIEVKELYTGRHYSQFMIEEIINSNMTNIETGLQKGLFIDFAQRMKIRQIKQHTDDFNRAMRCDPYLNALRCVYGYAITCHKAQGGEWDYVYLDFPRDLTLNMTKSNYQWLYTAITRARKELHLLNGFYIDNLQL